ncbi:hypothetical protein RRG08_033334 [Elysia crispata]|uniref:Uncharacterized protein n=1 Tax=Elysia crispata TaxID=231223 RepID=A0AAE0XMU7_9GAST|nr:hypothetical protein RRG08_033334 [Elysia crispata]
MCGRIGEEGVCMCVCRGLNGAGLDTLGHGYRNDQNDDRWHEVMTHQVPDRNDQNDGRWHVVMTHQVPDLNSYRYSWSRIPQ